MKDKDINLDLDEQVEYLIDLLSKSGFFSKEEMEEILEDQFIEEELDFSKFNISLNNFKNVNFNNLENVFNLLASENIVAIHNCGYDIEEGVEDAFELFVHLNNNGYSPDGFCFYTFEDIEEAIHDKKLRITFGDFENDELKALDIGKIVARYLKTDGFEINWDENINSQIEICNFEWDKSYDAKKDYEIEGAYDLFVSKKVLE